jgi:DNA-binding MarR family transcriptional regulator
MGEQPSHGAPSDGDAKPERQSALAELRAELRRYQTALDAFDEAVSGRLGLNRTDLRCLDLLEQLGSITAGALAEASGLTSGAVTFVIDRLESAGFVHRRRDEQDRRRVVVDLDAEGRERAWALHAPLVRAARATSSRFSLAELRTIAHFLNTLRVLYEQRAAELRTPETEAVPDARADGVDGLGTRGTTK